MSYLGWFLVGAGVTIMHLSVRVITRRTESDTSLQKFALSAVLGGTIFGTTLWMIFN